MRPGFDGQSILLTVAIHTALHSCFPSYAALRSKEADKKRETVNNAAIRYFIIIRNGIRG